LSPAGTPYEYIYYSNTTGSDRRFGSSLPTIRGRTCRVSSTILVRGVGVTYAEICQPLQRRGYRRPNHLSATTRPARDLHGGGSLQTINNAGDYSSHGPVNLLLRPGEWNHGRRCAHNAYCSAKAPTWPRPTAPRTPSSVASGAASGISCRYKSGPPHMPRCGGSHAPAQPCVTPAQVLANLQASAMPRPTKRPD